MRTMCTCYYFPYVPFSILPFLFNFFRPKVGPALAEPARPIPPVLLSNETRHNFFSYCRVYSDGGVLVTYGGMSKQPVAVPTVSCPVIFSMWKGQKHKLGLRLR